MEKKKNTGWNLLIFIVLIIATFYIIFKDQNIGQIVNIILNVKLEFVVIAVVVMFGYISCEAINIRRTLKALGNKISFIKCIKYTLIGFFFSSITPAASGGQPLEVYYMHKEGLLVSHSTLAVLMQLLSFQIVSISLALVSVFINIKFLTGPLIGLFILGITLNLSALFLLFASIFSKRILNKLIQILIKILEFLRVRNIEEKKEKIENELNKYQGSADYIKENKIILVKTILTTLVQTIIYYSIPYWVYLSFGFNEFNIFQIITLQAVLYATVSGIPLPGAVGISEGGFLGIFKSVFTPATISSAMLLNRGISFYFMVVVSGIVVIVNIFKKKKSEVKEVYEEDFVDRR